MRGEPAYTTHAFYHLKTFSSVHGECHRNDTSAIHTAGCTTTKACLNPPLLKSSLTRMRLGCWGLVADVKSKGTRVASKAAGFHHITSASGRMLP
eukprot:204427-Pelagomonas_calceolata.AAC.2